VHVVPVLAQELCDRINGYSIFVNDEKAGHREVERNSHATL
jgi:hypothetical protein